MRVAGGVLQVNAGAETVFDNGTAICLDVRDEAVLGLVSEVRAEAA